LFNNKPEDKNDFCESYKSQILGTKDDVTKKSLFSTIVKLLTILILLVTILGISFYGYNYFMNAQQLNDMELPPVSMQVSDDDLIVEAEDELIILEKIIPEKEIVKPREGDAKIKVIEKEKLSPPVIVSPQIEEEIEIDMIANDVKIAIAKSEEKEENETKEIEKTEDVKIREELNNIGQEVSLEVPTSVPEAKYLEELADLSKEIDKERK